jgi:hypothetical protein
MAVVKFWQPLSLNLKAPIDLRELFYPLTFSLYKMEKLYVVIGFLGIPFLTMD